jgi:hypothetical protein
VMCKNWQGALSRGGGKTIDCWRLFANFEVGHAEVVSDVGVFYVSLLHCDG